MIARQSQSTYLSVLPESFKNNFVSSIKDHVPTFCTTLALHFISPRMKGVQNIFCIPAKNSSSQLGPFSPVCQL